MMHGTVQVFIDTETGDLFSDMEPLNRVFARSQVRGEVTDVAGVKFPRVLREVLRGRGYGPCPVIMSTEDARKLLGVYYSVCDERGLTE
ncbi:Uncharacterised protein [Mycobacteroides abscessus subsp. abscessus]|uniref:hypothetical protein n=1 Tax=Mycobacteroides abscessus TaxID=36809 RepID=UPI0009A85DAA|nr:hypothetical protein [Mycobacteroides abscessus]SKV12259.1 Uncharacterised protein [Mycobacteroides abscessus subsp. abscessus]